MKTVDPVLGRSVPLPVGGAIPAYGLGTWRMGEDSRRFGSEVEALRLGLDLGFVLIDTAEMYGDGGAEEVVGEAIKGRHDGVFVVSKVLPTNASRAGTVAACERSLKRLGVAAIDLYLLHWPSSHPLAGTVEAFEALKNAGKIKHWGVSNFDKTEMDALMRLPGGRNCATNQVLYNLGRRGIEFDLLPWSREHAMPIMAYSPVEQGRILENSALAGVAKKLGASPAQVALAWLLRQDGLVVIPKAADPRHLRDNAAAAGLHLPSEALRDLDRAFPAPKSRKPLEML